MRIKSIVSAIAMAMAAAFAYASSATAQGPFNATASLSGANEVGPVITDTDGKFEIMFDDDAGSAEYELNVGEGTRLTQAHLHCAPAGSNGPIFAFLAGFHALGWDVDGEWISHASLSDSNILGDATPGGNCTETIDTLEDAIDAIENGNVYVNVHSVANAPGEVRGQLEED